MNQENLTLAEVFFEEYKRQSPARINARQIALNAAGGV